jgi:hypothetical protein
MPFPRILHRVLPLLGACVLAACEGLEHQDLTARASAPHAGPSCASCHSYPLRDVHHNYHLLNADTLRITKNVNGRITCLDCHNNAMVSRVHVILDSICVDFLKPTGWSSVDEQVDFQFCITFNPLTRVDTIRQNRPAPAPARPGDVPLLEEWMTGYAHMNGVVDVKFDPRVNHNEVGVAPAKWDPELLTCTTIACHEFHGEYRWAAPSKGFNGLREGEPH